MTYTVFFYGIYLISVISVITLTFYKPKPKLKGKREEESVADFGWLSVIFLLIAVLSILFAFYAPYFFTNNEISKTFSFQKTGEVGDTIGGLMNPFIALAGVIVTGLAFYMQYRANKLQIRLFLKGQKDNNEKFQYQINQQQFESQFYEMLRLHKENVNEFELKGKELEGDEWISVLFSKRQIFRQMQLELESLLNMTVMDLLLEKKKNPLGEIALTEEQFTECYEIFFWGYDANKKYSLPTTTTDRISNIILSRYPLLTESLGEPAMNLKFNIIAYKGHSSMLGHYFRHLFMLVKFVAESKIVTEYEARSRYLKILRAQLSNYEQIMLFYNWLSKYGNPWEDNERKYFTEYSMIHNLWHNELFENALIKEKINYLISLPFILRKGDLFEVGDELIKL